MAGGRLLAALLALLAALAAPAQAKESMFQDDDQLVYSSPATVNRTLDILAGLGVDRLRVTVLWRAIAPSPDSRTKPGFDSSDPASYPQGVWDRYDRLVRGARDRGMDVNFNVTAPGPLWAMKAAPRPDIATTYEPDPTEFSRFVVALGRRYSGTYGAGNPYFIPPPRVSYWSLYNEPNQSGWLTPQWAPQGRRFVERSPRLYRGLADAAYLALAVTGHAQDTILVGETAPKGRDDQPGIKRFMTPLRFLRGLYCVNRSGRALRGAAATAQGCRTDGNYRAFAREHPVLFRATGFAHHPYNIDGPPDARPRQADYVTLSSLGRLTQFLDRALRRAGVKRRLPLYLTEHGYQSNPPDRLLGVSWATQARYLQRAEHLASDHPRVKTLSQFLLVDARDLGAFQTGLFTVAGKEKPALRGYRLPVEVRGRGRRRSVWALLRAAPTSATATIEVRRGSRWTKLATTGRAGSSGVVRKAVRLPSRSTAIRVSYRTGNATVRSLTIGV